MIPYCRLKVIIFSNYASNLTCCNVLAASRCTFSSGCSIFNWRLREARYCISIMVFPSGFREGITMSSFNHALTRGWNYRVQPGSRQAPDSHLKHHFSQLHLHMCPPSSIYTIFPLQFILLA